MSFKKNFYLNNFSGFLEENRNFFKKYNKIFVKHVYGYILKLTKKEIPNLINDIEEFYINLFVDPFLNNKKNIHNALKFAFKMQDYNINIQFVLNRVFLLMTNQYIKEILKESNPITKLKNMSLLLDFYLQLITYHLSDEELNENLEIPKELFLIYNTKKRITLLSIYKGIPISATTPILEIDEKNSTVRVKTNNYQIIASKYQKEIFILENENEYTFRANILKKFPRKKEFILNRIEKIDRNAPKRSFIRVQPKDEIEVTMQKDNKIIKANLYDISLRGMCIIGDKLDLNIGDIVKLEFIIFIKRPHLITTYAEVKSITKIDSENYRYHLYFELKHSYETILEKYISLREKEIINELNAAISNEFYILDE